MKNAARPFVFLNVAMTADGKIATANHAVSSFGSKRDLEHLYELRATADAVMSGARTIEFNHAALGAGGARFEQQRLRAGLARYSLRIVVSGSASIDPAAAVFQHRFSPIVVLTTERASATRVRRLRKLADDVFIAGRASINFPAAFHHLYRRWNVRRLLCEGGGQVNDALFRARLVDEVHLTICPLVFGGRSASTLADGLGADRLSAATALSIQRIRRVGPELFVVCRVKGDPPLNCAVG